MTETKIIPGDVREPAAGHLSYDITADVPSPLFPMGPTTLGKDDVVYAVTQDRTGDKLRIGFSFVAPGAILLANAYADRLDELPAADRAVVEAAAVRVQGMRNVLDSQRGQFRRGGSR